MAAEAESPSILAQLSSSLNEILSRISAQEKRFSSQLEELEKREEELLCAYQRKSQRVKRLQEVIASTEILFNASNEWEIGRVVVKILHKLYPEATIRFLFISTHPAGMKLLASAGSLPALLEKCKIGPLDCPVIKRGKPWFGLPENKGLLCLKLPPLLDLYGHVCMPLLAEGVTFGVLSLTFHSPFLFDHHDEELLNIFSTHVGLAFTNARLVKIAVKEALTDQLTGLPNRRYALDTLQKEISRVERYGGFFSLAMVDLDNFKAVNALYGHSEGDRVLILFATTAGRVFRKTDLVARYGGEEFLLLFPQTKLADSVNTVEGFKVLFNQATLFGGLKASNLTFSAGVAEYPTDGQNVKNLIEVADQRLYKAKGGGRNQVVWE